MQRVSSALNDFSNTRSILRADNHLSLFHGGYSVAGDTLFARGAEFILMARIDIRNNYIFPLECRSVRRGLVSV